jgi:hypothetical protein
MKTQILEALSTVVREFQDNPYAFLYEEDIRATLFYEIRKRIPDEVVVNGTGAPEHEYRLRRVYCEYGNKIDIACLKLDSDDGTQATNKRFDTFIYNFPVEIGIELKYRKIGDAFTVQKSFDDYQKLKRLSIPNSFAISFIQDEFNLPDFLGTEATKEIDSNSLSLDGIFVVSKKNILKANF